MAIQEVQAPAASSTPSATMSSSSSSFEPASSLLPDASEEFHRLKQHHEEEAPHPLPVRTRQYRLEVCSPAVACADPEIAGSPHCLAALRRTRVTLFTREGYFEAVALSEVPGRANLSDAAAAVFGLETDEPTVLNEVRIRAVEWEWEGGRGERTDPSRVVPPFSVFARMDPPATGEELWTALVSHRGTSEDMEARALVLRNAPTRHLCSRELVDSFLRLGAQVCWREAKVHSCTDISLSLARRLLEKNSKLKSFLAPHGGSGSLQLKQWPAKDGVQAMAAWWLAALLVESHAYTEPELYAILQSECAYRADLGTIRKELVRRGLLEQPEITQNDNQTTSTYYFVSQSGVMKMPETWIG